MDFTEDGVNGKRDDWRRGETWLGWFGGVRVIGFGEGVQGRRGLAKLGLDETGLAVGFCLAAKFFVFAVAFCEEFGCGAEDGVDLGKAVVEVGVGGGRFGKC
jgi:hypothetical protein